MGDFNKHKSIEIGCSEAKLMEQIRKATQRGVFRGALGTVLGVLVAGSIFTLVEFTALVPSEARRVRVIDTTDAETKAYCNENPDQCKTSINWGTTIGMFLVVLLLPLGWKITRSFLDQVSEPGVGEKGYVRPADRQ